MDTSSKIFLCQHQGHQFKVIAARAPGREIRDYHVIVRTVLESLVTPVEWYHFDLVMVRTPPKYICNAIKVYSGAVPLVHKKLRNIWLQDHPEPNTPELTFEWVMSQIVLDLHLHQQLKNEHDPTRGPI